MSDTILIEKRGALIGDASATDTETIQEVARDSWPKLVAEETRVYDKDGDTVIYHGPADPLLYDEEDRQMMRDSDTVTVVKG